MIDVPKGKRYWITVQFCMYLLNMFLIWKYMIDIYEWKISKKLYKNSVVNKWSTKNKYILHESLLRYTIEHYSPNLDAVEANYKSV